MFRARLRSKMGCEKCRKRRKKCDEMKPICGACRRWNLSCTWSDASGNSGAKGEAQRSGSLGEPKKAISNMIVPFQDQAQFTLVTETSSLYSHFMWPQAASEFKNLDVLATVAMHVPLARSCMAAFTGYMLFTQSHDIRTLQAALRNYQIAVQSMRRSVADSSADHHDLGMAVAATFLGLLEVSFTGTELHKTEIDSAWQGLGTGDARFCIAHFSLVARISKKAFSPYGKETKFRTLYRIVLEDTLYNLACMSLLHNPGSALDEMINWEEYSRVFDTNAHPRIAAYELSPHFGGNYEFYRIMLEVVCFSGGEHNVSTRRDRVAGWLQKIESLEERLETYYQMVEPVTATLYKAKYQLHALALRIYCLKIEEPDIKPMNSAIKELVCSAESICSTYILEEPNNPAIAWPLMIFLCASSSLRDFDFFVACIDSIKDNFGQGHLTQLVTLIGAITPLQHSSDLASTRSGNPLDILIGRMKLTV